MASRLAAVQAPVGGWNTRDAVDDMPPEDAIVLDNWFPGFGSCEIRKGIEAHATSVIAGTVETLFEFNAGAYRYLIAVAGQKILNVEFGTATDITNANAVTNNRWQHAQFDDASGGARIGMVNGTDAPLILSSGPTVAAMTISGSGLTPANLDGVHIHKSRSYFWDTATQDFWYSSTNALGGALTKFPLGRVSGTGGNLTAMVTWSTDSGSGLDDFAVFLLSSGDVLMYSGSDPGDANDWALVARYRIGAPVGQRAIAPINGDVALVTRDGYVSLSSALLGRQTPAISDKISGAAITAVSAYAGYFGWQITNYPQGNKLIVNVPTLTGFEQHVMNTRTRAWCRYTGINARCWTLFNDEIYIGTDEGVYLAETGASDDGTAIAADGLPAWNYFSTKSRKKHVVGVQPIFATNGTTLSYGIAMRSDFAVVLAPVLAYSATEPLAPTWDVATWDAAYWDAYAGGGEIIFDQWRGASALGMAVAARVKVQATTGQTVKWLATNYMVNSGGMI